MFATLLNRFATWALSQNPPGGYRGEDDDRWAYVIETEGSPYLTRVLGPRLKIPFLGEWRVLLHHFHRPDIDQDPHNHPWARAFSFVLSGAYTEERIAEDDFEIVGQVGEWTGLRKTTKTVTRLVRYFNTLSKDDYHRVTELHGDVWTLFVAGERVQDWGFLVDGKHVQRQEYLKSPERIIEKMKTKIGRLTDLAAGLVADVQPGTGEALDRIGECFGVRRAMQLQPNRTRTLQDDDSYRASILRRVARKD